MSVTLCAQSTQLTTVNKVNCGQGATGSDPEAGPRCATPAASGFHRRRPKQRQGSLDFAGKTPQGAVSSAAGLVRTREERRIQL